MKYHWYLKAYKCSKRADLAWYGKEFGGTWYARDFEENILPVGNVPAYSGWPANIHLAGEGTLEQPTEYRLECWMREFGTRLSFYLPWVSLKVSGNPLWTSKHVWIDNDSNEPTREQWQIKRLEQGGYADHCISGPSRRWLGEESWCIEGTTVENFEQLLTSTDLPSAVVTYTKNYPYGLKVVQSLIAAGTIDVPPEIIENIHAIQCFD